MFVVFVALFLTLLPNIVQAVDEKDPDVQCLNGIRTAISLFIFESSTAEDYWGNICQNELGVHSMWSSAKLYCTATEIQKGNDLLASYCTQYGSVELVPYSKVLPDMTDEYIASLQIVEFTDVNASKIWDHAVILSKSFYATGYHTTASFERQYVLHATYGWAIYGFWGGLLLIGMLNRLTTHILETRYARGTVDDEAAGSTSTMYRPGLVKSYIRKVNDWMRTNLTTPATFGTHHQRLLWGCTIPTRMESVIVAGFWILNLVLTCVSYEVFWPNLYYTAAQQGWRYVADRTGIICYANLPFLWIFAGRNNIFLWLTGWSYSTFNIFHRNIARLATLQAVIHSICYTVLVAEEGELAESWTEEYWYMGGMATLAMSIVFLCSVSWLRLHTYEIFLLIHIAMSVLIIVGLFYHTKIFDGAYDGYLWPLVAIWLFDRFARLLRLFYTHAHFIFSRETVEASVMASYDDEGDFIRLQVTPKRVIAKPNGGQHYFLYQPNRWRFYENHPFTLAAWERLASTLEDQTSSLSSSSEPDALTKELGLKVVPATAPTLSESESVNSRHVTNHHTDRNLSNDYKLTFILRPFDSWTKRLRNECIKSPSNSFHPKIYLEGPYGHSSPLHLYENVIFIAGGSGITAVLPYLQDHVARCNNQQTCTRDTTFIWSTKQLAMVHSLAAHELRPYLARDDMHFSFHATAVQEAVVSKGEEREAASVQSSEIEILTERPDVRGRILDVVDRAYADGARNNRTAVFVCGPAGMADEARAAVHEVLRSGKIDVNYFEDTFGW